MDSVYEAQAKYYANIPLIQRDYIASVHLEDKGLYAGTMS